MITSSLGFIVENKALKINCFAPDPTIISSTVYLTLFFKNFFTTASRNSKVPETAV